VNLGEYYRFCAVLNLQPLRDPMPPARLKQIPEWMSSELIITEHARVRLKRWLAAGSPDADPAHVVYGGDHDVRVEVVHVLSRVPPPVLVHILTTTLVIGVGETDGGWWDVAPAPLPQPTSEPLCIIALAWPTYIQDRTDAIEELRGIAAHEMAHGWLCKPRRPSVPTEYAAEKLEHETYIELASKVGSIEEVIAPGVTNEQQAAQLATVWGFRGAGTDHTHQMRAARRRVLDRIKE